MPTRSPSFSIIVTCYNYGRYVAQAIESALSQTYANKQLIVVNDGSTDDSLEVISRYADRVQIIDQPNAGSIAAYNRGYQAASGDAIVLLDADDVLAPGALDQVAAIWTEQTAKVQWDLSIIDAAGRDLGRKFCNFDPRYDAQRVRDAFRRTGTYRWPVSAGNAYARWFADELFPLSPAHGPDGALNTVAPVYGVVETLARPLGSYRIHGRNIWSNTATDVVRLPERIRQRSDEAELMRQHAHRRGVEVPSGSVLDHEIAFVNYRMMAKALELDYPGSARDSRARLLRQALRVLRAERYPTQLSLAHMAWFSALAVAPPVSAARLISARFSRNNRQQSA